MNFDPNESLGNQPLDEQVRYLRDIGDFSEARLFINDMIKYGPQIENMRRAISEFISDERIPREQRVEVWKNTPSQLTTIASYVTDLDDAAVEAVCPDWIIKADVLKHEERDLRDLLGWCEFEDPIVERVLIDMCLKQGIHGFINDW